MSRQRTLSVHTEHELLLKLELAGITEEDAQLVIASKGNTIAKTLVNLIRNGNLPTPSRAPKANLPRPSSAAPKSPFKFDKTGDKWELLEDVGFTPELTESSTLEFVSCLTEGENRVKGEEMAKRAIKLNANLGQQHAEWLLEHQSLIPAKLRGKYLVFLGTIWRRPRGLRIVSCLYWREDRWCLSFVWLDSDWGSSDRLVRLCESPALEPSEV